MQNNKQRTVAACAYVLFITMWLLTSSFDFSTVRAANGHLAWKWLQPHPIVAMVWLAFLIAPFIIRRNYMFATYILATFIISVVTYINYGTWGSMWCWMYNMIWVVLLAKVAFEANGLMCKPHNL